MDLTELISIENNLIYRDKLYLSKYKLIEKLQYTNNSEVYKCSDINNNIYILKIYYNKSNKEISVLKKIKNLKYVTKLIDYYIGYEINVLILDYIDNEITFNEFLNYCHNFNEREQKIIFKDLCNIVKKVHDRNIIHGDIKPENIIVKLFKEGSKSKIESIHLIDFSCSLVCKENKFTYGDIGTEGFKAPEIRKRKIDQKIDVFNLGIILFIMLSGVYPFIDKYFNIKKNKKWNSKSKDAKDLSDKLLEYEPNKRLKSKDILKHSWLKIE